MVFLYISKQGGSGGPLINCNGEVIGINFYEHSYTSFLPINIASRCLECLEKNAYVHLFLSLKFICLVGNVVIQPPFPKIMKSSKSMLLWFLNF